MAIPKSRAPLLMMTSPKLTCPNLHQGWDIQALSDGTRCGHPASPWPCSTPQNTRVETSVPEGVTKGTRLFLLSTRAFIPSAFSRDSRQDTGLAQPKDELPQPSTIQREEQEGTARAGKQSNPPTSSNSSHNEEKTFCASIWPLHNFTRAF